LNSKGTVNSKIQIFNTRFDIRAVLKAVTPKNQDTKFKFANTIREEIQNGQDLVGR